MNSKSFDDRLSRAKVILLLDHPFFGTLATRLPQVEDPTINTAATDGKSVRWNPKFLEGLSDPQVAGVLAHEVLHVANGHTWRRGSRDPRAWNVAADKAINPIILEAGLSLPTDVLLPDPTEKGKAAESLYQAPGPDDPKGKGKQPGNGPGHPGGFGEVEDTPGDDAEVRDLEADWRVALTQAVDAAKNHGKLPGSLARLVDSIVSPKVPYDVLLRDFLQRTARNDYSWARPNVRHFGRGIILPTLISDELPEIVVAFDVSGSIGQEQLNQFAAEVSSILGAFDATIHAVGFDTRVTSHEIYTRADLPIKLHAKGGGGTDFRPIFKWVQDQEINPAAIIVLTDLMGSFPAHAPEYPTLWISSVEKATVPFGDVIYL